VVARLKEVDAPLSYSVNQPVLLGDPSRPAAREYIFQRLRPAEAGKWIAEDVFDKLQNAEGRFTVVIDPVPQVLPKLWMKHGLAFSGCCQAPSPGAVSLRTRVYARGLPPAATPPATAGRSLEIEANGPFP